MKAYFDIVVSLIDEEGGARWWVPACVCGGEGWGK